MKYYKYPCIVLVEKDTEIPVVYTGFERYLIFDAVSKSVSDTTLNKQAYCVVVFLNYLLYYSNCSSLTQITIDDIKTFLLYQKSVKKVEKDYFHILRNSVLLFLKNVIKNNAIIPFKINSDDLIEDVYITNQDTGRRYLIKKYQSFGISSPRRTRKKNRFIPYEFFEQFLLIVKLYKPELALAVALQAYAGLRESEIVNLTTDSIFVNRTSFGSVKTISIDLNNHSPFCENYAGQTQPGRIKKPRKQMVYSDFVDEVEDLLDKHFDKYLNRDNGNNIEIKPLFTNKKRKPLTVQYYSQIIKTLFYDRFIPYLQRKYNDLGTYADIAAYIDSFKHEYPGAHMFRHWFTMYLLTKAKNGGVSLSAPEIMKWRGDSSITSMDQYIHENTDLINTFNQSVSVFQNSLLGNISFFDGVTKDEQ